MPSFEELIAEGSAVPVDGWDFSWFAGRATEERPSWGYHRLMGDRMATAHRAVDLQTGGGEVLATSLRLPTRATTTESGSPGGAAATSGEHRDRPPDRSARAADESAAAPRRPPLIVATEGWAPNAALARQRLAPLGVHVVRAAEDAELPFADGSFDLVVSRHPIDVRWSDVARVLAPGGTYFSQQVGAGSVRELSDFMMGPRPVSRSRQPDHVRAAATAAGLDVVDLRSEALRMEFFDIAAVVVFLRKVIWTVPGFTVEAYRNRLRALHERIVADGPFVAHAQRFLIEAHKPRH